MRLDDLRAELVARLGQRAALATFARASEPGSVLSMFTSPLAAIDALLNVKSARDHGRGADALLRAVLHEYQSGAATDVWSSILLVAFYPSIATLVRRLRSRCHGRAELRMIAVEAFLAGARSLRNADDATKLPVRLKREMNRRAFDAVQGTIEDHERTDELVLAARYRGRIEPFVGGRSELVPAPDDHVDLGSRTATFLAKAPGALPVLNGPTPSVRGIARALRPDLDEAEQERLYQRIKRSFARDRVELHRVRPITNPLPAWWGALTEQDQKRDRRRRA